MYSLPLEKRLRDRVLGLQPAFIASGGKDPHLTAEYRVALSEFADYILRQKPQGNSAKPADAAQIVQRTALSLRVRLFA